MGAVKSGVIRKILGLFVAGFVGYGAAKVAPIVHKDSEPEKPAAVEQQREPSRQTKAEPKDKSNVDYVWRLYETQESWVQDEEPNLQHPELLHLTPGSLSYQEHRSWEYYDKKGHLQTISDVYTARLSWTVPPSEIDFGREDGLIFHYSKYVNYEPRLPKELYHDYVERDTPEFGLDIKAECEYVGDGAFQYGPDWQYRASPVILDGRDYDISGIMGLRGPGFSGPIESMVNLADGNWELVIKQWVDIKNATYEFKYCYRLEKGRSSGVSYYTVDDWIDYWSNAEQEALAIANSIVGDDKASQSTRRNIMNGPVSTARLKKETLELYKRNLERGN